MTTIAYDGRYLAADTLAHRHNTPSNLLTPKIDMCEGFAYAVGGCWLPMLGTLIAWHRAGGHPAAFPNLGDLKGGLLVVELATGRLWVASSECHWLDEEAAPYTCGSGGDYALAAIDCDRNAMEAVQVASNRDLHTNDTIDFIDLEWPEKGVQRWDGLMPSMRNPMPVHPDDWACEQYEQIDALPNETRVWTNVRPFDSSPTPGEAWERLRIETNSMLAPFEAIRTAAKLVWKQRPDVEFVERVDGRWHGRASFAIVVTGETNKLVPTKQANGDEGTLISCGPGGGCGACQRCLCAGIKPKRDDTIVTALCATENSVRECPPATTDELLAVLDRPTRRYFDGESGKLITAADVCDHGYVRRTCERCSHAPAPTTPA
jgi:hypothetical protein